MKLLRRDVLRLAAGAAAMPALPRMAFAQQAYPSRPVHMIVGFGAGSAPDIVARLTGQWLSDRLGQPFLIENRPGAASNIATEAVVRAAPDGYTIQMTVLTNVFNTTLYTNLKFNFGTDIAQVAGVANAPYVVIVPPSFPAKTIPEFIAYAKANPGKINMASGGTGSSSHIFGELFKAMAGIDMVHVPYRGVYMTDLLAGQVQVVINPIPQSMEFVRAGKVRALAVTTPKRTALLPDLPTVDELGIKGFDATTWHGLVAPAGTPKDVIDTLHFAVVEALKDPATQKSLIDLGVDIVGDSPKEFEAYIKTEIPKWTAVVKQSGAQID
jgi:tripartite-type tricarboxylate transporter receptor subunit TctC